MSGIVGMLNISAIVQFIKFGIVGVSNTVLSLVIYYICIFMGVPYLWANTISWGISILNAYYWNNKYVFTSKKSWKEKLIKTYCSYGFTYVVSMILLYIFVEKLCFSDKLAPIFVLIVTVPLNYILSKFWSFKE